MPFLPHIFTPERYATGVNSLLERPAVARDREFALSCGCVTLTHEAGFEIRWCPLHEREHGAVPFSGYPVSVAKRLSDVIDGTT